MQYNLDNIKISMFLNMATELRDKGWNIFWHASGDTDAFTTGPEAGTITLLDEVPLNPTFITSPSAGDYASQDEIVTPAFAMQVQPPRKIARLGLGHTNFEREMDVFIGGIASDSRQQATLASALYEWLEFQDTNYYMPISDYSIPASPVALDPAEVWWADVSTLEVATEVDTIRYQINIELKLRFVE
jgi:hypothetical protein